MCPQGMFRVKWWHLSLLCLALMSMNGHAESSMNDDPPQITFDTEQGIVVTSEVNITGTYIDESLPLNLVWKVYDGAEIVESGDLSANLQQLPLNQSSRELWSFHLNLNFSSIGPCSCVIAIEGTDVSQQTETAQLIVFSEGNGDENLSPRVIFDSSHSTNKLSGVGQISAIARDDGHTPDLQWSLSNDSAIAQSCALSWIENPNVNWTNATLSSLDQSFSFDTTTYGDGSYSLLIRAVTNQETSVAVCRTIGIDNQFPTAAILGPSSLNESSNMIHFDGSSSDDGIWGRAELVFLWVLEGGNEGPQVVSGKDLSTYSIDGGTAGNFSLTLTVVDEVGFTDTITHTFSITNQPPVASLRVSGQPLADGDRITLIDSNQWPIECRDSQDTSNDQDGLVCTWSIDGVPVMTGWSRNLDKPDDLNRPHTLTLLVTDNDGANDSISVTFGVQGTPSDPAYATGDERDGSPNLPIIAIIATFAVIVTAAILINRRYSTLSGTIPKWKRE